MPTRPTSKRTEHPSPQLTAAGPPARTQTTGRERDELAGLRVADFTAVMAGPLCTRLMADLGARVVKIESPAGDHTRSVPPIRDGHSANYGALNAGKESVVLDFRTAPGLRAAHAIIDWADVVVESFRPGVMARHGLDFDVVSKRRPDIVYCSISGYGQSGPWAQYPATAQAVHATSGYDLSFLAFQRHSDTPPDAGIYTADAMGGLVAFGGIMAALRAREASGVGRYVDVSLTDGIFTAILNEIVGAQFPEIFQRRGYPPFRTKDGFVMIAGISQRTFEAMATAMDRADLVDDPRFRTNPLRWQNSRVLEDIVSEWTATRPAEECEAVMLAAGCPAARYLSAADQMVSEQVQARGSFVTAEDGAGQFQIVDAPFQFRRPGRTADVPPAPPRRVPGLGADTATVLTEILGKEVADDLLDGASADQSPVRRSLTRSGRVGYRPE